MAEKRKRKREALNVLEGVDELAHAMQASQDTFRMPKLADLESTFEGFEVEEKKDDDVRALVERVVARVVACVLEGEGFSYTIPSRAPTNQHYMTELNRIVLGNKVNCRQFSNAASVRKVAIITRVLQLVHELTTKHIHTTKRDLFYTDCKLFVQQKDSDDTLDDVATLLGCTRTSLNVVASEKGVVVGRISFREAGDEIDCTCMGVGGKAIPPLVSSITHIRGDARFILLVEKDAAFMRLAEDRFYNRYPSVIITAKGQPDVATRLFLKKIRDALQIPILGLVDSDPYGLKILSVYMSGSKNMSYDSYHLTTSDIKWLGVRPSDLERYKVPSECRLDMTEEDVKFGHKLLEEDFIKENPTWAKELEKMMRSRQKAEIQALSSFGLQYLTEKYLPEKLRKKDWI